MSNTISNKNLRGQEPLFFKPNQTTFNAIPLSIVPKNLFFQVNWKKSR